MECLTKESVNDCGNRQARYRYTLAGQKEYY